MKTKIFTLFLALIASVGLLSASVIVDRIAYNLNETELTAEVTSRGDYSGSVVIPSSVTYNAKTYSVTSIGENAFFICTSLTSIEIPNSVTSIGNYAFEACIGLTSLTIPNSVTSIGDFAFFTCTSLTSIEIPNSVTSIGEGAFGGCKGLTSVTIPNSVTSIGDFAFRTCTNLTFPVYNDHVFVYLPLSYSGAYTIPNGIKTIAGGAFYNCSALTSVTIPNSVISIGNEVFYNCTSLINIYTCDVDRIKQLLNNDSRVTYKPSPYTVTTVATNGTISQTPVACDMELLVTSNYGYHFTRWADGNTDNPRTIVLTHDTIVTAEFAKNTYSVQLSCDETKGQVSGAGTYEYLDTIQLNVSSVYGYHFDQWSDGNTQNPRNITLTQDTVLIAEFAKNTYTVAGQTDQEKGHIEGIGEYEYLDTVELSVISTYGYHFTQWSDGNTDNPRTIVLTQDTTFTAEFAINQYTIHVSCDETMGHINGENGEFDYLTERTYEAVPDYGYHFVRWSNGETLNPYTVTIKGNIELTAEFAKNVYTVAGQSDQEKGHIEGLGEYEYLDTVELSVISNYGYHFAQWSDGNTDNPRTIVLTQDTTLTAEFALDKSGTCGADNALLWSYDDQSKTLTITGNGALTDNYTFGLEAPTEMNTLIIGDGVTAIGDSAFYGMTTISHLFIGTIVTSIGDYAFSECRNLNDITCYAGIVPTINATTFANVGDKQYIYLYVPENREQAYKSDEFWSEFNIQIKEAEVTTSDGDVKVVPTDNTAEISWPTVSDANTYEVEITKDGEVSCVLTFNANGQLGGIAFTPGRNGANYTQQAQTTGFKFTVTGLTSGTQYGYVVTSKNVEGTIIDTKSGTFTTTGERTMDIDQITNDLSPTTYKILRNGQILILRGDKTYTITGQEVK